MAKNKEYSHVTETGRVRYVEPNFTNSYEAVSEAGITDYELDVPLEDYCIYVNLEVEVRGRTININGGSDMKTYVLSYESDQGGTKVNFLRGSKIPTMNNGGYINSLTTNYTDIFITDLQKKENKGAINDPTTEMFGISSIDVAYNNYMVPEVTIQFVDVRGVSLFAQEEYRHNNPDGYSEADIAGSFFKCFFTFPYPKFRLLVKGIYGEPVSYELTCSDFRAKFDSNTGNFGATAKFVGYMFSFLGDISLNSIVAAPYSDYIGSDYWKSKVEDGSFKVFDENGMQRQMPKFGELVADIKKIMEDAKKLTQNDPAVTAQENLQSESSALTQLKEAYNNYSNAIKACAKSKFKDGKPLKSKRGNTTKYKTIIGSTDIDSDSSIYTMAFLTYNKVDDKFGEYVDNGGEMEKYLGSLKVAIDSYNAANTSRTVNVPDNACDLECVKIYTKITTVTGYAVDNDLATKYNNSPYFLESLKAYISTLNTLSPDNNLSDIYGYIYYDGDIQGGISGNMDENSRESQEASSKVEEAVDKAITTALGFPPTVENYTRMVMAHFETFAYMVFKTAEDICNNKGKRTLEVLGLGSSDITDVVGVDTSYGDTTNHNGGTVQSGGREPLFIPPFPKVTHTTTVKGEEVREDSWVGDYSGDFREKDLIHGLINGVNEFARLQAAAESAMQGRGGEPTVSMCAIPAMVFDFFAKKNIFTDMDGFKNHDEMAGQLALRAFGLIGLNGLDGNEIEYAATADAYNFVRQFKKPNGILAGVQSDDNFSSELFNAVTKADSARPWGGKPFLTSNGLGYYTLTHYTKTNSSNEVINTFIPVQNLKSTMGIGKLGNAEMYGSNSDYLVSNPDVSGDLYCSNSLYIERNPKRFSTMLENQYKYDDPTKKLKEDVYNSAIATDEIVKKAYKNDKRLVTHFENEDKIKPSEDGANVLPFNKSDVIGKDSFYQGINISDFNNQEEYTKFKRKGDRGKAIEEYKKDFVSSTLSISSFYGVSNVGENGVDSDVSDETSIFGQEIYYMVTDQYVKSFLFIKSMNNMFDYDGIIKNIMKPDVDERMQIVPYMVVLYMGALSYFNEQGKTGTNKLNIGDFDFLKEMRPDMLRRLSDEFVKWTDDKFVPNIDAPLAICDSHDKFKALMDDLEKGDKSAINVYKNHAKDSFFKNYMAAADSVKSFEFKATDLLWSLIPFGGGVIVANKAAEAASRDKALRGIALMNRSNGPGVENAVNEVLSFCCVAKSMSPLKKNTQSRDRAAAAAFGVPGALASQALASNDPTVRVSGTAFRKYLSTFTDKLKELYKGESEPAAADNNQISQAADPEDVNDNIKIALYKYCKLIYDKWLAGVSNADFEEKWTSYRFFDDPEKKYFHFVDTYYSDASDIFVNIEKVCDLILHGFKKMDYSALSYMSKVYQDNHLMMWCIQNFINLADPEAFRDMFRPVPYLEMKEPKEIPNFVVMYSSEMSSNLDKGGSDGYKDDSFVLSKPDGKDNNWPKQLLARDAGQSGGFDVPAFGVSFGKMYQSYFQDIDVSMESPVVTEQSLQATFAIASQNNESGETNSRQAVGMGQDLFTVYSNNSYSCTIKMLGCAWVQPLMYFVLNNVPMFRGTYLINKVIHHIENNQMTTTFRGVRMSYIRTRKNTTWLQRRKASINNAGGANDGPSAQNLAATYDNNCPYKEYPVLEGGIGGNYGQKSYAHILNKTLGELGVNGWGMFGSNETFLTASTAVLMEEAGFSYANGKGENALRVTAALHYNYVNGARRYGKEGELANIQAACSLGAWAAAKSSNQNTKKCYEAIKAGTEPAKKALAIVADVFKNGSASAAGVPCKMVWNVDKWGNNTTGLKTGQEFTLTPERAAGICFVCFREEWEGRYEGERYGGDHPTQQCSYRGHPLLCGCQTGINNWLYYCAEPKYWEKEKKQLTTTPKALNDNSKKIDDFAMGFYNAVQQTSNNSAVKVEFGVSEEKSSKLNLYLTNGRKSKNFGAIFDIILNTSYYNHVNKLTWNTDQNNLKNEPTTIYVELNKAGSSGKKVMGISLDDGKTVMGDKVSYKDLNPKLCRTIAKKYKTAADASKNIGWISDLEEMYKEIKITECSTIVKETAGTGSEGSLGANFAGSVTNLNMKKVLLNLSEFVDGNGKTWKINEDKVNEYHGKCTCGPTTWYKRAGVSLVWWSPNTYPYSKPSDTVKNFKSAGMKLVFRTDFESWKKICDDPNRFRPGDVVALYVAGLSVSPSHPGGNSSHGEMWDGKRWRSDTIQRSGKCYGGGRSRKGPNSVLLFRHPDFQEPGMTVTEIELDPNYL